MPEEGKNILKFANHHKQMRVPFIIYADFEALNIPVEGCAGDPQKSYTQQIAKQVPCSYCYVVVRSDGVTKTPVLYRGENPVEHFLKNLQTELSEINEIFRKPVDMIITANDYRAFTDATFAARHSMMTRCAITATSRESIVGQLTMRVT